VTVNHDVLLVAVHGQPSPAVTFTGLVPPPAATDRVVALREYEHAAAA
jgi:hypothetical protein